MGSVAIFKGKLVKFLAKNGILVPTRPDGERSIAPSAGETAFNTTANKLEVYNGTTWEQLGAASGIGLAHPTSNSTYEFGTNNPAMTGTANTSIGRFALDAVTSGSQNSAYGNSALSSCTTGSDNIGIGTSTLFSVTTGADNIAIGSGSGQGGNISSCIMIGSDTGGNISGGIYNTIIGTNNAGRTTGGSVNGVVLIGVDSTGNSPKSNADNVFALGTSNHRYSFSGIIKSGIKIANSTNDTYVSLISDGVGSSVNWILPCSNGSSGQVLSTDGLGVLSWTTPASAIDPNQTITTAGYALSSTAINTQTTSYILQSTDNGRIIIMNSSSAVNVTVPAGLNNGFNCSVIQVGTGQVTIVASGVTLNSANGLKTAAQHAAVSIISYIANTYNVSGNTTI